MKRKSIALLLALMMCLLLLSACGANNTPDAEEPPASENTSAEQQPADEKEEQSSQEPEQEEPKQEEPEKAEEPTQEEPEEVNNAGTEFLALLQEEYENGFYEGEGAGHTCYFDTGDPFAFIYNGVVYYFDYGYQKFGSYDIASKEFNELNTDMVWYSHKFIDGNYYCEDGRNNFCMFDCNGVLLKSINPYDQIFRWLPFDKGFLCEVRLEGSNNNVIVLLSYNLEEIAEIPFPQHEVEHGLIEDVKLNLDSMFAADGTVYVSDRENDRHLYRLNTDTYEWEDIGNAPDLIVTSGSSFLGKYRAYSDGIYDCVTGEQVFEYGELYHGAYNANTHNNPCYFGGDKYLGHKGNEYRWVSLTDLSMSDPLPFPEGNEVTILNDTYCVYRDKYGVFLWNYNDGTEETIIMFDN